MDKEILETVVFEHNFQKDVMLKALEIVKKFIQFNHRILSGGMSLDMALRTKNLKLYPDNHFPDYDFYSPEFHRDAYNLGQLLAEHFDGVSVIMAFHVSTMKVRINFQEVADISYIPQNLYDKIPTMTYQGFTIVHPHYQMIDKHRALSLPFEVPPLETVMGRWEKDIKRYQLICQSFSMPPPILPSYKCIKIDIPVLLLEQTCIGGYAALLYWIDQAKQDGYQLDNSTDWYKSWQLTSSAIKIQLPEYEPFSIFTDDYVTHINKYMSHINDLFSLHTSSNILPSKIEYNAILDNIPRRTTISIENRSVEIIDNKGNLRSAYKLSNYYISNLQDIMCYLLTMGLLYDKTIAIAAYQEAQKILFWASNQYNKTMQTKWLKYLPTVETYGSDNCYTAYNVAKENIDAVIHNKPRIYCTPQNAYPTKLKKIDQSLYQFDPTQSKLYQFNGLPIH